MWVSQTYLGGIFDSNVFVYLFHEEYVPPQSTFRNELIARLRTLGARTRKKSAILVPDDVCMEFIKEELRQRFAEFFRQFDHYTPGLFSCNKNLVDLDVNRDRWVYLSIKFLMGENEHEVVQFFRGLEEVIVEEGDVLHHLATLPVTVHRSNILKSLALQLTPPFVSVHVAKAIESSFMKQNGVLN